MHPVIAIVGPTGSGKSELGLCIARQFQASLINCDSVQVYTGLDIGSAKTPVADRLGIPHHLVDVVDPVQELTAGGYARLARAALRQIQQDQRLPLIVGGTGLYLRAFLDGLSPAPQRNEDLRHRLRAKDAAHPCLMHRFLRLHDPAAAARIHPNDHQKLIRAVELIILGKQPATATQSQARDALPGIGVLKLGLNPDRPALYQRLNRRAAAMFAAGLLPETARLLHAGVPPTAKALQSLGYKQAVEFLAGRATEAQAIEHCQTRTRQYAKRQLTWFRHEEGVQWLEGFGSDPEIQHTASRLCRDFLRKF